MFECNSADVFLLASSKLENFSSISGTDSCTLRSLHLGQRHWDVFIKWLWVNLVWLMWKWMKNKLSLSGKTTWRRPYDYRHGTEWGGVRKFYPKKNAACRQLMCSTRGRVLAATITQSFLPRYRQSMKDVADGRVCGGKNFEGSWVLLMSCYILYNDPLIVGRMFVYHINCP